MQVVITGANQGIGLALCQQYQQQGASVTAMCRQASPALQALGVTIIDRVELTDPVRLAEVALQFQPNSLDLLIHNAGIFSRETLAELAEPAAQARLLAQFQVDAMAPLLLSQQLLFAMKQSAEGLASKIAMISSRMGSIADNTSGGYYGYRMAKAALNAGSVSLAQDVKAKGIAVGIYHPGFVQTQMVGFAGDITPATAAKGLCQRIAELSLASSGQFFHQQGERLPW